MIDVSCNRIKSKYNFNHKTVGLIFDNDVFEVQTLIHSLFSVHRYYVANVAVFNN